MTEQQNPLPRPRRFRRRATAAGLVAVGAATGGLLSGTLSAGASTVHATAATTTAAAAPAPASSTTRPGWGPLRGVTFSTGTVTAVGTSTVTIKTGTATNTYTVAATATILKDGKATLAAVKVGDTVRFTTTTTNGTTINRLLAGDKDPGHGPGGFRGVNLTTGTVTAVRTSTVTIKTSTATKTYTVVATATILKDGKVTLAAVKVGDTVRFTTTTTNGTTINRLLAGDKDPGHGPWGNGAAAAPTT